MDLHLHLARRWATRLARRFPAGGIAVAGSVGARSHTTASDLDLLVVEPQLTRDAQLGITDRGVRVNVLYVDPRRFSALLRAEAVRFGGVALPYVAAARPWRDPDGHLADLQQAARVLQARRTAGDPELLAEARATAEAAAARVGPGPLDAWGVHALGAVADAALLACGRTAPGKQVGRTPFTTLADAAPELHALVRGVLEGTSAPRETIARMLAAVPTAQR